MLVEFPYSRAYLYTALESGPETIAGLCAGVSPELMDFRPDPDRFTIREVLAHLADWEPIWMERMRAVCEKDEPTMPGYEPGDLAIEHNYAASDPARQIVLLRERRSAIVAFLKDRSETDWQRKFLRPEIGKLSLEALTLLIPLHDLYHAKQIEDWKRAFKG